MAGLLGYGTAIVPTEGFAAGASLAQGIGLADTGYEQVTTLRGLIDIESRVPGQVATDRRLRGVVDLTTSLRGMIR